MIERLLVANRGEIARRVMRTCRALGIETVAVFSDADADAAFVADADLAVPIGGETPADSYLRIDAIVDAARRSGADAVHPGYGFLAESAPFARAVAEAGLTFVGPSPEAIDAMGSKLEAKRRMAEAGVPLLPSAELTGLDEAAAAAAAADVGYPILIKASAGGGGRGMRIVAEPEALAEAVAGAAREATSAFGDGTIYAERYVSPSRHVEVQIFGDTTGRVVHFGERECSIQRRHQKIIEEAPSASLDDETRGELHAAAVRAGEAIGYTNAGTVEFLLAPPGADGRPELFFLEVNTRLQVEHPVTEAIYGVDLVELQLEVADGGQVPEQSTIGPP
ncbi:MAG: biotin carboxylase N-terminal domain-containing protein, partial [Acidimicrobiales bacterium]